MIPDRSSDPMHRGRALTPDTQNHSCAALALESPSAVCGARTRSGVSCRNMSMKNGRCRMHGGASTGPKTADGLARWRASVTIHGGRSREMIEFRRRIRELRADARRTIEMA